MISYQVQISLKEFDSMLNSFSKDQVENMVLQLKEQGMSLESYVNALSQDDNIQLGIAINKWIEKNRLKGDHWRQGNWKILPRPSGRIQKSCKCKKAVSYSDKVKTDANESQVHDYAEGLKMIPK